MTEDEAIEAMARAISDKQCSSSIYDHPESCLGTPDCDCGMLAYAAFAALRPHLDAQFAAGAEAMRNACADNCQARYLAELLTRAYSRFHGREEDADMHADRAGALNDQLGAICALPVPARPTDTEPTPAAQATRRLHRR